MRTRTKFGPLLLAMSFPVIKMQKNCVEVQAFLTHTPTHALSTGSICILNVTTPYVDAMRLKLHQRSLEGYDPKAGKTADFSKVITNGLRDAECYAKLQRTDRRKENDQNGNPSTNVYELTRKMRAASNGAGEEQTLLRARQGSGDALHAGETYPKTG